MIDGIKRVCVNLPGGYQCLTEIVAQDEHVLFDTGTVHALNDRTSERTTKVYFERMQVSQLIYFRPKDSTLLMMNETNALSLTVVRNPVFRVFVSFRFLLTVPVNNVSVMSGRSHRFFGTTSTFGE